VAAGRRAGRGDAAGAPAAKEDPPGSSTLLARRPRPRCVRVGRRSSGRLGILFAAGLLAWPAAAPAQIDPEPRANIELGVEGPLRGDGSTSGYAFFLWNRPHLVDEDWYWRLILAPTYLQSETVRDRWPAPGHAVGFGLNGGFFPFNYDEFRDGSYKQRESFWGHGMELPVSYYRRLKIADLLPVEGQLRLRPGYVFYQRSGDTDLRFRTPDDTPIYALRSGIRVGGEPPELLPDVALEASIWYEVAYRQHADTYGFAEQPLALRHTTQQAWARLGGALQVTQTHTARAFLTAGVAPNADALTAFRLGSALPFRREFPLVLHGYYVDEIFAERFWLVNLSYRLPVWPFVDRVKLQLSFDYAMVDYLAGHTLPRRGLRGLGADVNVAVTSWATLRVGYGYGWDAPRGTTFGGHELGTQLELKLK
jgi:hypothetical protein